MRCERCKADIEAGEARELHGQTLCADCYMDTLSPAKACDPWAEPKVISERLQIKPSDLERECAALRHMEKVKGALREGKKILCLW